jgi:hypothetical protein
MKIYMVVSGKTGAPLQLFDGSMVYDSIVTAASAFQRHKDNNKYEDPCLISMNTKGTYVTFIEGVKP